LHSREAATYALSNINNIDESLFVLIDLLDSSINHESVRGRAAEGIANIQFSRKKNIKKKAEDILIKCLQDPSPTVRFWSCFAVGVLRFKKALPILKEIKSNDHEICPGWWYVSEEAEDAIESINGRHGKHRISVNQRSSSIPDLLE
jgi:HEAT repeat protein